MGLVFFFLLLCVCCAVDVCVPSTGSSVEAKYGFLRVKGLAIVRSRLELVEPRNDYKPAGSKR
jgi:hypothetical protein